MFAKFQNTSTIPNSYGNDVLEGNWYEDRCHSSFDERKKKNYKLDSPYDWQYTTTYKDLGVDKKDNPTLAKFAISSDNYINFQAKDNNMYVTTTKNSQHPSYRDTFREPKRDSNYYKNKPDELEEYRNKWTKKTSLFETTYEADLKR